MTSDTRPPSPTTPSPPSPHPNAPNADSATTTSPPTPSTSTAPDPTDANPNAKNAPAPSNATTAHGSNTTTAPPPSLGIRYVAKRYRIGTRCSVGIAFDPSKQPNRPPGEEPARPERGHGRGRITLHVVGGSPELRGVPLIGTGPGGLANTRPGGELGMVRKLERELRDLAGSSTQGQATLVIRVSSSGVVRFKGGKT